jgi:hypothetical protein
MSSIPTHNASEKSQLSKPCARNQGSLESLIMSQIPISTPPIFTEHDIIDQDVSAGEVGEFRKGILEVLVVGK